MSLFIEVFSKDVDIHGDSTETEAKFNVMGWPFNMDLSEAAESKVSAHQVDGVTLTQLECVQEGSFITIRFSDPIPGGEFRTVRLRAKVFV